MNETELNNWYEQKNELMFLDKSIMKERMKEWKGKKTEEFYTLILLLFSFDC